MKRILILVTVVLIGIAPAAWARTRYFDTTLGRIRYSPYAFGFGHSGLIPDNLRYSLHANGLVHESMRYSPYAFDAQHDGLVSDNTGYYGLTRGSLHHCDVAWRHQLLSAIGQLTQSVRQLQGTGNVAPWQHTRRVRPARSALRVIPARDPMRMDQLQVVNRHLRETIPGQYYITRVLRLDGETVSFDVVLKNSSTVIKVWNPKKFKSLRAQQDRKKKVLDRYLQTWARFGNEHEMKGGAIHHISSNDSTQLIAKLATHTELRPGYRIAKQ